MAAGWRFDPGTRRALWLLRAGKVTKEGLADLVVTAAEVEHQETHLEEDPYFA